MNTKAEVLATLPGDGWSARYLQDDDTCSFEPVVAFVTIRHNTGRIDVIGLVPNDPHGFERATKWTNFDGYVREG